MGDHVGNPLDLRNPHERVPAPSFHETIDLVGDSAYVTISGARLARLLETLIALSEESAADATFIEIRDDDAFAEIEEALNVFAAGFIEARRGAQAIERELRRRVEEQEGTISALSVPIVELWHDVIALPIVGNVDEARAHVLEARLLARLDETGARYCIVDLTGVTTFQESLGRRLLELSRAAEMLGARCILSGLRGEVAREIVRQNIDLQGIATTGTLHQALRLCLSLRRGVGSRPSGDLRATNDAR